MSIEKRVVDMHRPDGEVFAVPYGPYQGTWRVLPRSLEYGSASPRGSKVAVRVDCNCIDCGGAHPTGSALCPERRW